MDASVNFCTSCGADLRQIPVENSQQNPAQNPQPVQPTSPAQQAAPVQHENPTNVPNPNLQQTPQPAPSRTQTTAPAQPSGFALYWDWLVASWKTPTAALSKEKWYGAVNILAEILLVAIACWEMMQKGVSSVTSGIGSLIPQVSSYASQQVQNVGVQLFFALLIASLVMILGAWATHAFLFADHSSFIDQINDIGQASNYNLIMAVVVFVLAFIGGANGFIGFLMLAMNIVFLASVIASAMGNKTAKRDRLFGALILLVIILAAVLIFAGIGANAVKSVGI